ncbi:MAG: 2-C-methyl-D-erythritol 4-phosphate cytidylyltransferase [Candidatus Cloacimonetes bacterium]|nr:2-C-methyl-D-erythritol 4-phosphate cytidylyltransferase [Candidatus Cloacimonadota bacterium]
MKNKIFAIITAGGKGLRMNSSTKKQFIQLAGKPILIHTIEKFFHTGIFDKIFVTLPKEDRQYGEKVIFSDYKFPKNNFIIIDGGDTRQKSVYNALKSCPPSTKIVVIHDSVRPFVKIQEIKKIVKLAEEKEAVVLGYPVKNTIKKIKQNIVLSTLDRKQLWEIFTPQAFYYDLIYKAHKNAERKKLKVNDDAELIEIFGNDVFVLKGSSRNIKITDNFDLKIAEVILNNNRKE